MGPNPDLNWGVTTDLFDRIFGTREIYLGTAREQKETKRRQRRIEKMAKKTEAQSLVGKNPAQDKDAQSELCLA